MALNTAYLSVNTSAQSNINSPYIGTGLAGFPSTVSVANDVFVNSMTNRGALTQTGAVTLSSTLSVAGNITATSNASVRGLLDVNSGRTQAGVLSYATTASAASTILPDGAFGIYFQSVSSCRLCYRSGNTTYTWIATTGAVL